MILIQLPTIFDVDKIEKEISELNTKLSDPNVYSSVSTSLSISKKIKQLDTSIAQYKIVRDKIHDVSENMDMIVELDDEALLGDLRKQIDSLLAETQNLFLVTLLNGKFDNNNAIIKIHSGAGGTESCDWVSMLYRMYMGYATKHGLKATVLDSIEGDGAGYKSISFMLSGEYAYGYLRGEMGVHRLIRISPFDANKRRHTSFASVEVMPEIDDDVEVNINPQDLRIDTYRSSGAGGQHINTTDSAIRITHIPTNTVVTCQSERSQLQNKETAMRMLKSKLYMLELEQKKKESMAMKGEAKKIEWGSQIRSYVLCPYTMCKDARTGCETSNVDGVLAGNLDNFIIEYLKYDKDN